MDGPCPSSQMSCVVCLGPSLSWPQYQLGELQAVAYRQLERGGHCLFLYPKAWVPKALLNHKVPSYINRPDSCRIRSACVQGGPSSQHHMSLCLTCILKPSDGWPLGLQFQLRHYPQKGLPLHVCPRTALRQLLGLTACRRLKLHLLS